MGGRSWTREEEDTIREMVAQGTPHADIAVKLGRTINAVRDRAQVLGAYMSEEHKRRNNIEGNRAMHQDPLRRARKIAKISAAFTEERRAKMADVARQVNAKRSYIVTPEMRKKLAKGLLEYNGKKLAWLPSERREEYTRLVHRMGASEAKRIILEDIAAKRAEMSPFERQMEALRKGAQIVAKPVFRPRAHDFSLTGDSLA